jgi:hypothetical protein
MTDDVSADVAIQGSTPQVANPAPKSVARTRKAAATEKAKNNSWPICTRQKPEDSGQGASRRPYVRTRRRRPNLQDCVNKGSQSQIPAAPTRAPTSPLLTTTKEIQSSQLPTLRKIRDRVDISKRESTPFHPSGIVEGTDRTSKTHFKCLDPTVTKFPDLLSSGTPTITGLWPVARPVRRRKQKFCTLPQPSIACNSTVATSSLKSIQISTKTPAGTWRITGCAKWESTITPSQGWTLSRVSMETLSHKLSLKYSRRVFGHYSAEDPYRPRPIRYTCRQTPGPKYLQQHPLKNDTVGDPLLQASQEPQQNRAVRRPSRPLPNGSNGIFLLRSRRCPRSQVAANWSFPTLIRVIKYGVSFPGQASRATESAGNIRYSQKTTGSISTR